MGFPECVQGDKPRAKLLFAAACPWQAPCRCAWLGEFEYDYKTLENKFNQIYADIENKSFSEAKNIHNQKTFFEVPTNLINIKDCKQYLGPTICKTLSSFEKDHISNPLFYQDGFYIIKLEDNIRPKIDASFFEDMKDKVLFDYNNERDDNRLKNYIQYLKDNAKIKRYSLND